METVNITVEQLDNLKLLYPSIAEYGLDTLLCYTISRHLYEAQKKLSQPQLPKLNHG